MVENKYFVEKKTGKVRYGARGNFKNRILLDTYVTFY